MKNTKLFAAISLVVLLAVFAPFVNPAVTFAHGPNNSQLPSNVEKIIVTNLAPGQVVSTNVGGSKGANVAAPGGGWIETFAPIGQTTLVYLWDPNKGQTFLGAVTPTADEPDIILNAQNIPLIAQNAPSSGFMSNGLASPLSGLPNVPFFTNAPPASTGNGATTTVNCPNSSDSPKGRDRCRIDPVTGKKKDQ